MSQKIQHNQLNTQIQVNTQEKLNWRGKRVFQREFALWAIFVHLGAAVLLPMYFSVENLLLAIALAAITGYSLGIFHHMYLSHHSFRASRVTAFIGALLGTLSWRGPMAAPLRYVALHKVHHAYSDQEFDPHSPVHGFFHAILGWMWSFPKFFADPASYLPFVGKDARDPWLLWLDRHVHLVQSLWALLLFVASWTLGVLTGSEQSFSLERGFGWLAYGVFAKTLIVLYLGNLVDVLNHGFGYRNYETQDLSTNSALMAVVHLGGAISWHNNHHAKPGYFSVRRRRWEFDAHRFVLEFLQLFGLVSKIKVLDESGEPKIDLKTTDFLRQSPFKASVMVVTRLGQFLIPLALQVFLFRSDVGLPLQVVFFIINTVIAAIGLHNLGLLGHEGTHFNLSKNKWRSSLLGTFFSSLVPFHFNTGFAISHSEHHLWTNTEHDPDLKFGEFKTLLSRLFLARRAASLSYFRQTLSAAFSNESERKTASVTDLGINRRSDRRSDGQLALRLAGLTAAELKSLARLNLFFSASFALIYFALAFVYGWSFIAIFAAVFVCAYCLSGIRPYLEHAGTDAGRLTQARTFSSAALDFVFGTINYHLAHHLSPRVPAYHLAQYDLWLRSQNPNFAQGTILHSRPSELFHVLSVQPYGELLPDSSSLPIGRGGLTVNDNTHFLSRSSAPVSV